MKVYMPECWVCKNAIITHGLSEKEKVFVGCMKALKKESCKYEKPEIVGTTSS